jgi:predicted nucleotidyltransferase
MPRNRISLTAIRRTARQIAEQFQPEQIILFGSYAYGQPGPDSDVDLLVIMPARNETTQSIRIRTAVDHPFPFDIMVRTPENLQRRLQLGDWFLREIVSRGKVLYAKADPRVVTQGRKRPARRPPARQPQAAAKR